MFKQRATATDLDIPAQQWMKRFWLFCLAFSAKEKICRAISSLNMIGSLVLNASS